MLVYFLRTGTFGMSTGFQSSVPLLVKDHYILSTVLRVFSGTAHFPSLSFLLKTPFLFKLYMIEKREPKGKRGLVGSLTERKVVRSLRQKIKFETLQTSKRPGSYV